MEHANLIPLSVWADQTYGKFAPKVSTLRAWARSNKIQPAPQKHGRTYYVEPTARYCDGKESNTGNVRKVVRHPAAAPAVSATSLLGRLINGGTAKTA